MKLISELSISGKRVMIRVDFNVPLDDQGHITDDTRIKAHLPTINYVIGQKGKVILASHLGRPKGKRVEKYSLRPVSLRLSELLCRPVAFVDDCVGPEAEKAVAQMLEGDVVLLENLRFHAEEEKNDKGFARELAKL